jgi:plastocyanin domain-containing protein
MKWIILTVGLVTSVPSFAVENTKTKVIEVMVTDKGFEPSSIDVTKGETVALRVTRKSESTCATQVQVPSLKLKKDLPLNQPVTIDLGKVASGEIRFGCGMGMMMGGVVHVN